MISTFGSLYIGSAQPRPLFSSESAGWRAKLCWAAN